MTRGETPVDGPGWSDIADWYDTYVRSGRTPHELATRALLELAGDVTGRRVVDVACGQGLATRALARAGAASVVGVDVTEASTSPRGSGGRPTRTASAGSASGHAPCRPT